MLVSYGSRLELRLQNYQLLVYSKYTKSLLLCSLYMLALPQLQFIEELITIVCSLMANCSLWLIIQRKNEV